MRRRSSITSSRHTLPFERLSPGDFERLCLWLVERDERYSQVEHLGAAGRDQGRDIVAMRGGTRVAFQCKRVNGFGPKAAAEELAKILALEEKERPDELVFFVSCNVSAKARKLAGGGDGPACRFVGRTELDERVKRHPDVLKEFFNLEPEPRATTGKAALFVAYAHRYGDWVRALQADLERALGGGEVILDDVDLGSGRSWVGRVEAGLEGARGVLLVATPEAFVAPRTEPAWRELVASRPRLGEELQVLRLVDSPLPPGLRDAVPVLDLRRAGADRYRVDLATIVSKYIGETEKNLKPSSGRLATAELPPWPSPTLPASLRRELVAWLAPLMATRFSRRAVAATLGLERTALDGHPSGDCAASAALVLATGDDDAVEAALRVVDVLAEELGEDEPERVAALQPLRRKLVERRRGGGLLEAYRRRLVRDHDQLADYFQEGAARASIEAVYVQLALRAEAAERVARRRELRAAAGDLELGPALGGALTLEQVLALEPSRYRWISRRWVVQGHPGAGKTTMLRHLAARLAREEAELVPVYASLPRLVREREWLLDRLARQMERGGHPAKALPQVLERLGQEGRLLLLLDGLDEVPADRRDDAEALLRDYAGRWRETPIVVASRPIGYRRPESDFVELELLPFDRRRRHEFLAKWLGRRRGEPDDARADEALAVLAADPGLWELSGNPLYLTLMALLLEKGEPPDRHRTELYDQVFDLLLDGAHKPDGKPLSPKKPARAALRYLGFELTRDNRDAEPLEELEARLYQPEADAVREPLERVPRWRRSMRPFLDELATKTGILGPHDGRDADWRFWHRTFREALASEQLAATWRGGQGKKDVLAHAASIAGDESRWAEPYALLAGRVADPDALVKALVAANRELGLRALATAQGLKEKTIREVLALTGRWEERAEVFLRIPGLLGDADRALRLLLRLAHATRDGNDLFFLHQAIGRVATASPDHAPQAEQAQAKLYDHIPKPDPALFESFYAPHAKKRVPLWVEARAGSFVMGGGGYNVERPKHQVRFDKHFRIGAVPVTNHQYLAFDPGHRVEHWEGVSEEKLRDHPVVNVTWYAAVAFCRWLRAALPEAEGARLPTEEEWEYACRAGTTTEYGSGDEESDLKKVGWYNINSGDRTHRVGELEANQWGLYDAHGNVWEWTGSVWTNDYSAKKAGVARDPSKTPEVEPEPEASRPSEPEGDSAESAGAGRPAGLPRGALRVFRGGSFEVDAVLARSAFRLRDDPRSPWRDRGFRVVLPPPEHR